MVQKKQAAGGNELPGKSDAWDGCLQGANGTQAALSLIFRLTAFAAAILGMVTKSTP